MKFVTDAEVGRGGERVRVLEGVADSGVPAERLTVLVDTLVWSEWRRREATVGVVGFKPWAPLFVARV